MCQLSTGQRRPLGRERRPSTQEYTVDRRGASLDSLSTNVSCLGASVQSFCASLPESNTKVKHSNSTSQHRAKLFLGQARSTLEGYGVSEPFDIVPFPDGTLPADDQVQYYLYLQFLIIPNDSECLASNP